MSHVVVVIGGGPLVGRALVAVAELPTDAVVIAADGGLDHAVETGLAPSVLVGDLDSITAAGTMWAYAHEVEIERYPDDKDATDTELALARAVATGCQHLLVAGGHGDRLDHTLGTLVALGAPSLSCFTSVRAVLGDSEAHVVHPGRTARLPLTEGALFSVLALHGSCRGVTVDGARWPLDDAELPAGSALGVSNEAISTVNVGVSEGVVTVVLP